MFLTPKGDKIILEDEEDVAIYMRELMAILPNLPTTPTEEELRSLEALMERMAARAKAEME